jgi:hypothetical protein
VWPFKKKPLSSQRIALPADWKDVLQTCDFELAKTEILRVLANADREAAARGGKYCYRQEFVQGLEAFAQLPCYKTAVALIAGAPDYAEALLWPFFSECCPGGLLAPLTFDWRPRLPDGMLGNRTNE